MKIKLILVDSDEEYVDRLLSSIIFDYENKKIEILAYTSLEQLMADKYAKGDVYLISSEYVFDKMRIIMWLYRKFCRFMSNAYRLNIREA